MLANANTESGCADDDRPETEIVTGKSRVQNSESRIQIHIQNKSPANSTALLTLTLYLTLDPSLSRDDFRSK